MSTRRVTVPSEFTYWQNWAISTIEGDQTILRAVLGIEDSSVKEKDSAKHLLRIMRHDIDYITALLEESPYHLDDPVLHRNLPIIEKELSVQAPFDATAIEKLKRLSKAKISDTKGIRKDFKKSKEVISRDIDLFIMIINRMGKEKSIEAIMDDLEGTREIKRDQLWSIYKHYKKIADKLLPIFNNSYEDFFSFLEICKDRIDKPSDVVTHKHFVFLKGQVED